MKRPQGRPPTGALLIDGNWTMTKEGLDLAAQRLETHRKACRDRYRIEQQLLRAAKPELFKNVSRTVGRDLRAAQLSLSECIPDGVGEAGKQGGS